MEKKNGKNKSEDLFSIIIVIAIVVLLIVFSIKTKEVSVKESSNPQKIEQSVKEGSGEKKEGSSEIPKHFSDIEKEKLPGNIIFSHTTDNALFLGSASPSLIKFNMETRKFQKKDLIQDQLTGYNTVKCIIDIESVENLAPVIEGKLNTPAITGEVETMNNQDIVKIGKNAIYPMAVGTSSGVYFYSETKGFEYYEPLGEKSVFAMASFMGKVFISTPLELHGISMSDMKISKFNLVSTTGSRTVSRFVKYKDSSGIWHLLAIAHRDIYEYISEMDRFELAYTQFRLSEIMSENHFVTDLEIFPDFIAVGTSGEGILLYDRFGKNVKRYEFQNGLPDNYVTCLEKTASGLVLIGTFNGIGIVSNDGLLNLEECQSITTKTGALSGNVRSISVIGNTGYFCFGNGVSEIQFQPVRAKNQATDENNLIVDNKNKVMAQAITPNIPQTKNYVTNINTLFEKKEIVPGRLENSVNTSQGGVFAPREIEYPIDVSCYHKGKLLYVKLNSPLRKLDVKTRKIEDVIIKEISAGDKIIGIHSQESGIWMETQSGYLYWDDVSDEKNFYKKPLMLGAGSILSNYSVFSKKRIVMVPVEGSVKVFDADSQNWRELGLRNDKRMRITHVQIQGNILYFIRDRKFFSYDGSSEKEIIELPRTQSSDLFNEQGVGDELTNFSLLKDKLVFGFSRSGIFLYSREGKLLKHYHSGNGLMDSMLSSVYCSEKEIVACFSDGVMIISAEDNKARLFNNSNGIVGRTVIDCQIVDNDSESVKYFRTDSSILSFQENCWFHYLLP